MVQKGRRSTAVVKSIATDIETDGITDCLKENILAVLRRLTMLFIGTFIIGCGVAIIALANLGASSMSSTPFVLAHIFGLSVGTFLMAMNIVFVLIQFIILRREFKIYYLLQVPLAILMGIFTDIGLLLFRWINPSSYILALLTLLGGILLLAFGAWVLRKADIVMVPNNMLSKIISEKTGMNFGRAVVLIDTSIVVFALVCGLLACHTVVGVREGTLVAALLTGTLIDAWDAVYEQARARLSR